MGILGIKIGRGTMGGLNSMFDYMVKDRAEKQKREQDWTDFVRELKEREESQKRLNVAAQIAEQQYNPDFKQTPEERTFRTLTQIAPQSIPKEMWTKYANFVPKFPEPITPTERTGVYLIDTGKKDKFGNPVYKEMQDPEYARETKVIVKETTPGKNLGQTGGGGGGGGKGRGGAGKTGEPKPDKDVQRYLEKRAQLVNAIIKEKPGNTFAPQVEKNKKINKAIGDLWKNTPEATRAKVRVHLGAKKQKSAPVKKYKGVE